MTPKGRRCDGGRGDACVAREGGGPLNGPTRPGRGMPRPYKGRVFLSNSCSFADVSQDGIDQLLTDVDAVALQRLEEWAKLRYPSRILGPPQESNSPDEANAEAMRHAPSSRIVNKKQ